MFNDVLFIVAMFLKGQPIGTLSLSSSFNCYYISVAASPLFGAPNFQVLGENNEYCIC